MRRPARRWWLGVAALMALSGLQALPAATAAAKPAAGPSSNGRDHALERRSADGRVTFLGSTDARELEPGPGRGHAVAAARSHLDTVGRSLGLTNPRAQLASGRTTALGQGRSIVRFDQEIGGVPVFAGQVAVSLAPDNALTSVLADVSSATDVARATVPAAKAEQVALDATSKAEKTPVESLTVGDAQEVVLDPDVVHLDLPGGARPAWQVEVGNGTNVRELVLVDGVSGRVTLQFNQVADALNRRVCNNNYVKRSLSKANKPCTSPVRSEGDKPVRNKEVNAAYRISGQTAQAYQDIAGLDLTELIGVGKPGHRQLRSTVHWCYQYYRCPRFPNAFWNGSEMYYGKGYALADDVVAHELTHGVTQHTSNLMYFHQSGAMNESFSDIFGEIVDQRYHQPGEDTDNWLLGEQAPGGPLRDMANPPASKFPQPDSMTSSLYKPDGVPTDANYDNGGVHTNSGVGNKLFYLVANGGTLNSVTVTGIDASDPARTKSARLFYEALVSLTTGSEYADLADVLRQRCGELAQAGTLEFAQSDCDQVENAIQATRLDQSPPGKAAQPADAPDTCPAAHPVKQVLLDGEAQPEKLFSPDTTMWTRAPDPHWGVPSNARSGVGSWFVWDPYPAKPFYDPKHSSLSTVAPVTLPAGQTTYVRFEHWRLFDYDGGSTYYDGGTLDVYQDGSTTPASTSPSDWDNPPSQTVNAVARPAFGGDSHGWVSSRLDLSSFAGSTVKLAWTSHGTKHSSLIGWFLDDIEVYTCVDAATPVSGVQNLKAVGAGSPGSPAVRLSWKGPEQVGSGIADFEITRSDASTSDVTQAIPGDPLPVRQFHLDPGTDYTFSVVPVDDDGQTGAAVETTLYAVKSTFAVSRTKLRKGRSFTFSGQVTRITGSTPVAGTKVVVQYRKPAAHRWRKLGAIVTDAQGGFRATVTPPRTFVYRILVKPTTTHFPAVSRTHKVRVVR